MNFFIFTLFSIFTALAIFFLENEQYYDYFSPPNPILNSKESWLDNTQKRIDLFEHKIIPWKIPKNDVKIVKLKKHLSEFRYAITHMNSSESPGNSKAPSTSTMQLIDYFLKKYDWQKWRKNLNQFQHFHTEIESLGIHFIHEKPTIKPGQLSLPVLLVHGWPGSFSEFLHVIPKLTNTPDDVPFVFEVVCVSLPGFAWSQPGVSPEKAAEFNVGHISRILNELMVSKIKLASSDHTGAQQKSEPLKYYVHGNNHGAFISETLAKLYPESVRGIHLSTPFDHTNIPVDKLMRFTFKHHIARWLSSVINFASEGELKKLELRRQNLKNSELLNDTNLFSWRGQTSPTEIVATLRKSPVNLMEYLIEKWESSWILKLHGKDEDEKDVKDRMDSLITNFMLYYLSDRSIEKAIQYRMEFQQSNVTKQLSRIPVRSVPTGLIVFENDRIYVPESWLKYFYWKLVSYTELSDSVNFGGSEHQALLIARDLVKFVGIVEKKS